MKSKRNSLCECGSLKKWKKCCLLKIKEQEVFQREYEKAIRIAATNCPCNSGKKFGECCLLKHDPKNTTLKREV
jgi:uncharacterized protein YecA (UPF0149 family)